MATLKVHSRSGVDFRRQITGVAKKIMSCCRILRLTEFGDTTS